MNSTRKRTTFPPRRSSNNDADGGDRIWENTFQGLKSNLEFRIQKAEDVEQACRDEQYQQMEGMSSAETTHERVVMQTLGLCFEQELAPSTPSPQTSPTPRYQAHEEAKKIRRHMYVHSLGENGDSNQTIKLELDKEDPFFSMKLCLVKKMEALAEKMVRVQEQSRQSSSLWSAESCNLRKTCHSSATKSVNSFRSGKLSTDISVDTCGSQQPSLCVSVGSRGTCSSRMSRTDQSVCSIRTYRSGKTGQDFSVYPEDSFEARQQSPDHFKWTNSPRKPRQNSSINTVDSNKSTRPRPDSTTFTVSTISPENSSPASSVSTLGFSSSGKQSPSDSDCADRSHSSRKPSPGLPDCSKKSGKQHSSRKSIKCHIEYAADAVSPTNQALQSSICTMDITKLNRTDQVDSSISLPSQLNRKSPRLLTPFEAGSDEKVSEFKLQLPKINLSAQTIKPSSLNTILLEKISAPPMTHDLFKSKTSQLCLQMESKAASKALVKSETQNLLSTFKQLSSEEWEKKILLMKAIKTLIQSNPDVLKTRLHEVCVRLTDEVKNLRSTVACAAIDTIGDLHLHLKKSMDPEVEGTGRALLLKFAQTTNTFILKRTDLALDALVKGCSPYRVLSTLLNTGLNHLSNRVRGGTALHLYQLQVIVGERNILMAGKAFVERFLPAVSKMCLDGTPKVRQHGFKILQGLTCQENFLQLWDKLIPQQERTPLNKIIRKFLIHHHTPTPVTNSF